MIFRVYKTVQLYLDDKNKIAEAVRSIKLGNPSAMKFLYAAFSKEMLTLSYRITNNMQDAEDVVQESFIHSFNVIGQLKDEANFGSWLKRIVLNNSLKRIKKRQSYITPEHEHIEASEETSRWYETIPFDIIQEAIQNLPNGCREILTLYLLDSFKHREIAEILKISVSTSKSQYQYGLKLLRTNLKKYAHE